MTKRPELGELNPGQPVMVRRSRNDMRGRKPEDQYISAVVVKDSHVWIKLAGKDGSLGRTWRMRRDTQNEATQYNGSDDSFVTLEQHAWDKTREWGRVVLWEHGIRLDRGSRWIDREAELANLLGATPEEDS